MSENREKMYTLQFSSEKHDLCGQSKISFRKEDNGPIMLRDLRDCYHE